MEISTNNQASLQTSIKIPYTLTAEQELMAVKLHIAHILRDGSESQKLIYSQPNFELNENLKIQVCKKYNERLFWEAQTKLWDAERSQKLMQAKSELIEKCTPKYFFNLLIENSKKAGKPIIYKNEKLQYRQYLHTLCHWLPKHPNLENIEAMDSAGNQLTMFRGGGELQNKNGAKGSLKKGLLIWGSYGIGKTYPIELLKDNELTPIRYYSLVDICKQITETGKPYSIPHILNTKIYFDDVGTEPTEIKSWGNTFRFFADYIANYYNDGLDFSNLIITTNLTRSELGEKYGAMVLSRIYEMFNYVQLTDLPDRRML